MSLLKSQVDVEKEAQGLEGRWQAAMEWECALAKQVAASAQALGSEAPGIAKGTVLAPQAEHPGRADTGMG